MRLTDTLSRLRNLSGVVGNCVKTEKSRFATRIQQNTQLKSIGTKKLSEKVVHDIYFQDEQEPKSVGMSPDYEMQEQKERKQAQSCLKLSTEKETEH